MPEAYCSPIVPTRPTFLKLGRVAALTTCLAGSLFGVVCVLGFPVAGDPDLLISPSFSPGAKIRSSASESLAAPEGWGRLLNPKASLGPEALKFAQDIEPKLSFGSAPAGSASGAAGVDLRRDRERDPPPASAPERTQLLAAAPLPVPRPPDLTGADATGRLPRFASRQISRAAGTPVPAPADGRSFFEKLLGVEPQPQPALSYAALDASAVDKLTKSSPVPNPASGTGTATYDVSAKVVHMPNGDKLEAHSGLADKLDDPRFVHVRMQGPTPPGTYELSERERRFHGVRALRLKPVGGSAAVHGRAGLLAHSFMLGPNGDSNGCVSFRDYDKFLQAYLRGEVKRLVVVAGQRNDGLPGIFGRFGLPTFSAPPSARAAG